MTCPDDLTAMMYADGELDASDRAGVEAHVAGCARCTALVAALREETRVLRAVLGDPRWDSAPAAVGVASVRRSPRERLAGAAAAIVVAAGLLRVALGLVAAALALVLPDWANPTHPEGLMNALVNGTWYLLLDGEAVAAAATAAAIATTTLLALAAAWTLPALRPRSRGAFALGTAIAIGLAVPAEALEIRRDRTGDVTVAAGETIDDTLIVMGDEVSMDGTVTGNLVAMARRVRVRGTVQGNLVAFARDVDVEGTVQGSVFVFAQRVTAPAAVAGDLTAFAQTVALAPAGRVQGNVTTFSESAEIEGAVGRDVTSFGRRVTIGGQVARRATGYAQRITIRRNARIEGAFTAHVPGRENVLVEPGATIVGATDIDVAEPRPSRYATGGFYVRQAIRLAAAFVAGWLFFWLVPAARRLPLDGARTLAVAVGLGAVALAATPILAVAVGITLVGLPLALVALMVWLVCLYLAKIVVALHVGRMVLGTPDSQGERHLAALLLGLVLVLVAVNLPYVGVVLNLLLTIAGLGALVAGAWRLRRHDPPPIPAV